MIETGEPFLSNDLRADGRRSLSEDGATSVQSFLAVPLVWRGGPFGILEVDSTATNAFHAADVPIVQAVGSILSGPIELARRYAAEVQLRRCDTLLQEAETRMRFLQAAVWNMWFAVEYDKLVTWDESEDQANERAVLRNGWLGALPKICFMEESIKAAQNEHGKEC